MNQPPAPSPEVLAVPFEVQEHDTHIEQLQYRLERLPEREAVEQAEQMLASAQATLAAQQNREGDLRKEERALEGVIADLDVKLKQADTTLYGGTIKGTRELEALQHEIAIMKEHQGDAETAALGLLDELETVADEIAISTQTIADVEKRLAADRATLAASIAEIEAEAEAERASRNASAATVPDDLIAYYEHYRSTFEGQVVAHFEGRNCHGCPNAMPATEADRVKHLAPELTAICQECTRYLTR